MKRKMQGDREWPMHYAALLEYCREYGHCNVPWSHNYECILKGFGRNGTDLKYTGKLGSWLSTQRQSKKGHGGRLSPERQQLLQRLVDDGKLLWKMRHHSDYEWNHHYAALLEYCKQYGNCNIPYYEEYECVIPDPQASGTNLTVTVGRNVTYQGKLGEWLRNQRNLKYSQSEELLPSQWKLLQSLVDENKLAWEESEKKKKPIEFDWLKNYYALIHYSKLHGHCNVPFNDTYECELTEHDMHTPRGSVLISSSSTSGSSGGASGSSSGSGSVLGQENMTNVSVGVAGNSNTLGCSRSSAFDATTSASSSLHSISNESSEEGSILHGEAEGEHDGEDVASASHSLNSCHSSHIINGNGIASSTQSYHYNGKLGNWLDNQIQAIKRQQGEISKEKTKLIQALAHMGKLNL